MEGILAGRDYLINGKTVRVRPLSFFEAMQLPDLIGKVLEVLPETKDVPVDYAKIFTAIRDEVQILFARCAGLEPEGLQQIPMELGMEMFADWVEANFSENFFKAVQRGLAAGKRISTGFLRS
jgi:hypothetical protein